LLILTLPLAAGGHADELRATSRGTGSPVAIVREFVGVVRSELQAIAKNDTAGAAAARARLMADLAQPDTRSPEEQRRSRQNARFADEAIARFVGMWECVLAYYIDGLDFAAASVSVNTAETGAEFAEVHVPAAARGRSVVIRFFLQHVEKVGWRVTLVDYLPPARPAATSQPAVRP
jgi:hypothetical protein